MMPFINAIMNISAKRPSAMAAIITILRVLLRQTFRHAIESIILFYLSRKHEAGSTKWNSSYPNCCIPYYYSSSLL
jgi:hypothetical protein